MKRKNILFVDDEPNILKSIKRSLKSKQKYWRLFFEEKPLDALKLTEKEDFDLIVTDGKMPEIDGCQFLALLNQNEKSKSIPKIMLSGYYDDDLRRKALSQGIVEFINKPIMPEEFIQRLKNVLKLKEYSDEMREKNKELEEINEKFKKTDEEKNVLIDVIVHSFTNSMQTTVANVDVFKKKFFDEMYPEQQKYVVKIESSVNKLKKQIEELIDINLINNSKLIMTPLSTNIVSLIKLNIEFAKELAYKHNIQIEFGYQMGIPQTIKVDSVKLEHILNILLFNSVKKSIPYSKIYVEVYASENDDKIYINIKDSRTIKESYQTSSLLESNLENSLGYLLITKTIEGFNGEINAIRNKDGLYEVELSFPVSK